MTESIPSSIPIENSPQQLEYNFGVKGDISNLSPQNLADYHLAVSLNLENPLLPDKVKWRAEDLVKKGHQNLLIATADAITKELLPWRGISGNKVLLLGQTIDDAYGENQAALGASLDPVLTSKYVLKEDEELWSTSLHELAQNKYVRDPFQHISKESARVIFGMRQELVRSINDPEKRQTIIRDTLTVGRKIFGEVAERHQNPTAQQTAWKDVASRALDLLNATSDPAQKAQRKDVLTANLLIGSIHGGGESILKRFTLEKEKAVRYLAVLDASRQSDFAVRALAGEAGKRFYAYSQMKNAVMHEVQLNL